MSDQSDEPKPARSRSSAPTFIPAPVRARHDGWTPERQRAFIEALADCGSVTEAARRVGMSVESAYRLRRHPLGMNFARAWEATLVVGVERLKDIAFERATTGTATPVFYRGEQVGERRTYNDRLLMFLLRHNDPVRYSPLAFLPGFVPIDRSGEATHDLGLALDRLAQPTDHDEPVLFRDEPSAKPTKSRERLRKLLGSSLGDNSSSRARPPRA
jgi:hypothetical protein